MYLPFVLYMYVFHIVSIQYHCTLNPCVSCVMSIVGHLQCTWPCIDRYESNHVQTTIGEYSTGMLVLLMLAARMPGPTRLQSATHCWTWPTLQVTCSWPLSFTASGSNMFRRNIPRFELLETITAQLSSKYVHNY